MMLLAESFAAPVGIAAWLACAFFIVAFWNQIRKAIEREKEKPAPAQTYATIPALAKVEQELKAEIREVDDSVEALRKETKDEVAEVAGGVERLREDIVKNGDTRRASIEGKVEAVKDEMHEKFADLHGQISALSTLSKAQGENLIHIRAVVEQINREAVSDRKDRN